MVDTLVVVTQVLGHKIVLYLAADISDLCSMFVDMANLATTPSSRDDGLVARLYIPTNMLHKTDSSWVQFSGAVRFDILIDLWP